MKRSLLVLSAIVALVPTVGWGGPVNLEVGMGTGPGWRYSYVHTGDASRACWDNGNPSPSSSQCAGGSDLEFFMSGTTFALTGQLSATQDEFDNSLSGISGSLAFTTTAIAPGSNSVFLEITNGFLNPRSGAVGDVIGMLDYSIVAITGGMNSTIDSGSFYFYDFQFTGTPGAANAPNSLTSNSFAYWGNNWAGTALPSQKWGIDLGGEIVPAPVPEPASLLLLSSGAGLFALRRRKRKTTGANI